MSNRTQPVSVVKVPLQKRSYPIYIGTDVLRRSGQYFKKHSVAKTVLIITDAHVAPLYHATVRRSLIAAGFEVRSVVIPAGEKQKRLERANAIFTRMLQWKIERKSTVVALGGGVVGDLAGFVAATYQRGVDFIQIPTSLLAQVDSSVGGKVGVNHPLAKNMIGSFYQPKLVIIDIGVLKTLPSRELVCGYGEVIKYGIILDKKFFTYSTNNVHKALSYDPVTLRTIVRRCCQLKAYVVAKDERESNLRAVLNFGHTIGHALEHAGKYSYLKHGEAILYGMIAEAYIARVMKKLPFQQQQTIETAISGIPLPPLSKMRLTASSLLSTMKMDKKVRGGKIHMVLPTSIGKVLLPRTVGERLIARSLQYLRTHHE